MIKYASRSTFHYCYWCKDKRTEQQHRRRTGSDVLVWVRTWCRGRPTVHPAAGCGPCWGWSGPDTSAVYGHDSTRCLRSPAGSPACRETARSRTSNPPDDTKIEYENRIGKDSHASRSNNRYTESDEILTSSATRHSSSSLWRPCGSRFMRKVPVRIKTFCSTQKQICCLSSVHFTPHHGTVEQRLSSHRLTCGTTPKAFLHLCRGTEFQETPSMEISPSVEARRSRAERRVLFPEPVRPSSPI